MKRGGVKEVLRHKRKVSSAPYWAVSAGGKDDG